MLIAFFVIIAISLFTLSPSFKLALLGDDWLAFFRYLQMVGYNSTGQWNHLTYFLTPYGAQDIMMGFLEKIFHYNSTLYYITSYCLRICAAISLYPLVWYLTKNKLGSFFAVIFFSVTVVGFDTTNWSSNMTTYITVVLFNFFLYFFLKSREQGKFKLFGWAAILYYLAYVTTPIRMHGSMPFIFLLETFWLIRNRNSQTLKKIFLRFGIIVAVFLFIRFTGSSQGPAQEATERFGLGIKAMSEMLGAGRFDFLTYPIIMFGSMIIPDFLLSSVQIVSKSQLLWKAILPSFLGFLFISFIIVRNIYPNKISFYYKTFAGLVGWTLSIIITFSTNLATFNDSRNILLSLVGGFSIFLIISLLLNSLKDKSLSQSLFLGLSWAILSFFFAWWWVPTSIFPTTYRYLIVSAVGIAILLGTIISLGKNKSKQIFIFTIFCVLLLIHVIGTRFYINYLLSTHSQEISYKIWNSIPKIAEIGKSREPIIFYFEADNTNSAILHDVVTFGFPPHMALEYGLSEQDGGFPVPMSDFKELVSAVTDGKTMPAYGYKAEPVDIDKIYAFSLQGRNNLVDITNITRKRLSEISN